MDKIEIAEWLWLLDPKKAKELEDAFNRPVPDEVYTEQGLFSLKRKKKRNELKFPFEYGNGKNSK